MWNRATTDATPRRSGDQALHDVFIVHGQVMSGGLLSTLDYIDYEQIERAVAGFEYLGMADAAAALRSALGLAFPDGPVAADEREEYTLGLPKAVLERVEGDLEQTLVDEDPAIEAAFRHAYRERPGDFEPV